MTTIHTIGHSNHPIERFVALLRHHVQRSAVTVEHDRGDGRVQTEDDLGRRKPQLRLFE